MESPIGNIMAAVAVLLIHIDRTTDTAPKTSRRRPALRPINRDDSAVKAMRRSRLWRTSPPR